MRKYVPCGLGCDTGKLKRKERRNGFENGGYVRGVAGSIRHGYPEIYLNQSVWDAEKKPEIVFETKRDEPT